MIARLISYSNEGFENGIIQELIDTLSEIEHEKKVKTRVVFAFFN